MRHFTSWQSTPLSTNGNGLRFLVSGYIFGHILHVPVTAIVALDFFHDYSTPFVCIGLCWSWGLILVMFPTFAEQLAGEHATKHVGLFLVAYLPYVVFPLLFAARLAIPSTVFSPDSSLVKKRS